MRYADFKALVAKMGWTMPQLRCDEPPTEDLLVLMDALGLDRYERFVLALQAERQADDDDREAIAEGDGRYYREPGAVDR